MAKFTIKKTEKLFISDDFISTACMIIKRGYCNSIKGLKWINNNLRQGKYSNGYEGFREKELPDLAAVWRNQHITDCVLITQTPFGVVSTAGTLAAIKWEGVETEIYLSPNFSALIRETGASVYAGEMDPKIPVLLKNPDDDEVFAMCAPMDVRPYLDDYSEK